MTLQLGLTLIVGIMALAAAWLPVLLRSVPLTIPMVAVLFGIVLYGVAGRPDLAPYLVILEHLTEYVLVIAVMGAGLKIDRVFGPRLWRSTWLLLGLALPIAMGLTALAGSWLLGLSPALALLLAAILSPTDPVLASDVQVGPPGEGEEGEVRIALTSEAGLNDGIAIPLVVLALALIEAPIPSGLDPGAGKATAALVGRWFAVDLLWRVAAGAALGAAFGGGLVAIDRWLPERLRLRSSGDGLAVLGVSLLVYAGAEWAGLNAFVAVFAAAVAARNTAPDNADFAKTLHRFADQLERLATVMVMALFGALVAGGMLRHATLLDGVFVAATLFAIRPVAVLIATLGSPLPHATRFALGFLGIRGLGSLFYLFFALTHADLAEGDRLRSIVGLVVLVSVVVYGLSATPVMRAVDARRRRFGPIYRGPVLDGAAGRDPPAA